MEKLLIIGDSSGLGQKCREYFSTALGIRYSVVGVNRDTHNLDNPADIYQVISMAEKFDVVLNIAKSQPAQSIILLKTFERWRLKNHTGHMISIGSLATNFDRNNFSEWIDDEMVSYLAHKKELEQIHNDLAYSQPFGDQPRSTLIKPLNIGEKEGERSDEPYCSEHEMLEIIEYALTSPCWLSTIEVRKLW